MTGVAEKTHIFVFTLIVTAFFGFIVSGMDFLLKERKEMNALVADQRVILQLFGLKPQNQEWTGESILGTFAQNVIVASATDPALQTVSYFRQKQGRLIVFPFSGRGFWDTIKGYIAFDAENRKIAGVDFTKHNETPGLGGRISEQSFKARFADRKISNTAKTFFNIVPEGSARPDHNEEIDGLTGATETSRAVETLINDAIRNYLPILEKEAKP